MRYKNKQMGMIPWLMKASAENKRRMEGTQKTGT